MSAVIPINKKYQIKLDGKCWAVCYWKPRNDYPNNGTWEGLSWHNTLQQAGESLVRRLLSEDQLEGVDEIINALAHSTLLIANAIKDSSIPDFGPQANKQLNG